MGNQSCSGSAEPITCPLPVGMLLDTTGAVSSPVVAAAQGNCPDEFHNTGISPEQNKEIGHKCQRARETKCRGAQTQEIWGGDRITKVHVQGLRLVRKNETAGAEKFHLFRGQAMGRWTWRGD